MSLFKGQKAEAMACDFLREKGLKLLKKNYSCKLGEIDLVMLEEADLVFIEVKARKNDEFGLASEFVDEQKQKKIIKAAKLYLLEEPELQKKMARFDVFEINFYESKKPDFNWIKDAFQVSDFSVI